MRIRTGFVSNSSSSSFILAIAVVQDEEKVKALLGRTLDIEDHLTSGVKIHDLKAMDKSWGVKFCDGTMEVENFQTSVRLTGLKGDEKILIVDVSNNEGDTGRFEYDDERGEIDYDITLDDLPAKWQTELFEGITEDNGLTKIDKCFGAARNG